MTISIGDRLEVNVSFVHSELAFRPSTAQLSQLLSSLGYLQGSLFTVLETFPGSGVAVGTLSNDNTIYNIIRVRPPQSNQLYNNGEGVLLLFTSLTDLHNSFITQSGGLVPQVETQRAFNNSASNILRGQAVYYTGVNTVAGDPQIALASAAAGPTSVVLGIANQDISIGSSGPIIISGGFSYIDTTAFAINDPVYLSDTPGAISNTPGTIPTVFARVVEVGTADDPGAIQLLGYGVNGGGGGGGGATGVQGATGIRGLTGIQGSTGISAAPSGTLRVLASVTGIDATAGAQTIPLYSVPASTRTIVTQVDLRLTAASGITTTVMGAAGWSPSTTNLFAPEQTVGVTAVNDMWMFTNAAKSVLGVAGATLVLGITGLVGTTGTFTADVIGTELSY